MADAENDGIARQSNAHVSRCQFLTNSEKNTYPTSGQRPGKRQTYNYEKNDGTTILRTKNQEPIVLTRKLNVLSYQAHTF